MRICSNPSVADLMPRHMTPFRALLAAIAALLLVVMPANVTAQQRHTVFATATELPTDVDMVFALADAASIRQGPEGERLEQLITAVLPLQPLSAQLRERWGALAHALDYDRPDVMFDDVFGERVVIASRFTPQGHQATVLITDISPAVEARIRRTLETVPRRIHANTNILRPKVDPQFSLAIRNRGNATKLYMTLAAHEELLEDVLDLTLDRPARTLATTDAYLELAALHRDPAAYLYLSDRALPGAQTRLTAVFAPGEENGVFETRFSSHLGNDPENPGPTPAAWPAGIYDAWKDRANVLILGGPAIENFIRPMIAELFPGLTLPSAHVANEHGLGQRRAFIVAPAAARPGQIDMAWVTEIHDVDRIARLGDEVVEQQLQRADPDPPEQKFRMRFDGMFPEAVRLANVNGTVPYTSTVAWNYRRAAAGRGAIRPDQDGDRGWWTWGCGRGLVTDFGETVAEPTPDAPGMPQLSVGVIHFDQLKQHLDSRNPRRLNTLVQRAASTIDTLSWKTYQQEAGRIIGSATIHFRD